MYGSACMAYHAGLLVNSRVSLWLRNVVDEAELRSFSKENVFVCFALTGRGRDSVTSILFERTGTACSSPSLNLPALATTLYVMALVPSGIERFQLMEVF